MTELMANEGLILESLIHLTKSGKILWRRTGGGYKTKISKIRITLKLDDKLNYTRWSCIYVEAPGKIGSYVDHVANDYVADELYQAIEGRISGESIDALEEKLLEMVDAQKPVHNFRAS